MSTKYIPTLKEIVKDNYVSFDSYRQGHFYYNTGPVLDIETKEYVIYQFPIPIEDIGTAAMKSNDKAITYMRWVRKAMDGNMLIEIDRS